MGIVGWADAPNEAEIVSQSHSVVEGASSTSIESPVTVEQTEELETFDLDANNDLTEYGTSEHSAECTRGEYADIPSTADEVERSCSPELIEAIHQLRLNKKNDDVAVIDISKFELHEIMFLFDHSASMGQVNEYEFVRELFAVKHRIMEMVEDIDSVTSPNLDELLQFAENKYQQSVNEVL